MAVAEMSENSRSDRSCQKCDCKQDEGLKHSRGRIGSRKKYLWEYHYRGSGEYVKIEKFDGGADEAGRKDAANRVIRGLLLVHVLKLIIFEGMCKVGD